MAGEKSDKKAYHHGDLRRALLDATLGLAADRGAGGVTLREAARVAHVSRSAPYRHFVDKQAMLAAASEEGFRLQLRQLQDAIARSENDARAKLLTFGVTYVRFALEHSSHFRLMYGHGSPPKSATPELQRAAEEVFQLFSQSLADYLSKDFRERAVKETMFRLWALVHGIATLALEKQILFDIGTQALIAATRGALAIELDASRSAESFARSVSRPAKRQSRA